MSECGKDDAVPPLKPIRHYDLLDDNITEEIQPIRKLNSRTSISKLKTSKSNYDPLSNQFDETNVRRRVSFSNLKAVKEFTIDNEKTVWNSTYEEAVHSSGSTTSASTSSADSSQACANKQGVLTSAATVASESMASATSTAINTAATLNAETMAVQNPSTTKTIDADTRTTAAKKIISLESQSADKENVPLVLSQEPLDLTIKMMPFSTVLSGKSSSQMLSLEKRIMNETSDEMDLTEINYVTGLNPVIDSKEMPIAESTTTVSAETAAAAVAALARANATTTTALSLASAKKPTVNQTFNCTAQDMEFTCVMEETKLAKNTVSPPSKPTATSTAITCQQNVNLSDDMEITNLMITEQEPIAEPSSSVKQKPVLTMQPAKLKLVPQTLLASSTRSALLQSPTERTTKPIEKSSQLISIESPRVEKRDTVVTKPANKQNLSPNVVSQFRNHDHDISLLARQTNNINLNGQTTNLSLISPNSPISRINDREKQSDCSSSSVISMSLSDSSKSTSQIASISMDTCKDNREKMEQTEIRNTTAYDKFAADFSITVNEEDDDHSIGDSNGSGNAKNNTSMVFIDNEKCDFLVSHSLINCSNVVVSNTLPVAENKASEPEVVLTSSTSAKNDSIVTLKSPIQIKTEREVIEELSSGTESKKEENLIDKEFAEGEKLIEDTLKVMEKYKSEAAKILDTCMKNASEFEAMTAICAEREQILAVCDFVNGSFEKFWQLPVRLKWKFFWKQFKTIKMHSCNLEEKMFSCRIYGVTFVMVIELNPDLKTIKNIRLEHSVSEKAAKETIEFFPHYLSTAILMEKMPNTDAIFDYFKFLDSESIVKEITAKFFEFMVPKP